MDICELGDLITIGPSNGIYKSENFIGSGTLLLDIKSLYRGFTASLNEARRIQIDENELKKYQLLIEDILINRVSKKPEGVGKAVLVSGLQEPAVYESNMMRFRVDTKKVIPWYVVYYLASESSRKELLSKANISNQASINQETVKSLKIPLLPLAEQKRIVEILGKCDRLRRTRRYALQLSDTFLQSVFLQMFGNPITNPMNWEIEEMGSQITSIRYGTSSPPEYQKTGIPFIRATNIKRGYIQQEGLVYISNFEASKIPKCKVKEGDLIIVRSGVNTGDSAVVSEIYDGAYAAYDLIVELPKVKANYYNFLINSDYGKAIIEPLTRRAGQPHINAEQVSSLRFPLPPLTLQEKFAQIVQKFERFRTQQREAERQAEHLFQTLLHRAFRGELTSSDFDDEAVSALSKEIGVKQAKAKPTGDIAEYLHTKVSQQEIEAVQLTLPGLE
jgi:type I restriction enzyme S subunit